MADHSINALRAAARAMQEVVLPAVDPSHPLAREQAALVAKFLSLFAERIDHACDRNRFELLHYLGIAQAQLDDARQLSPAIADALVQAVRAGSALRDQAGVPVQTVRDAAQELAAVLTALVRTAAAAEAPLRGRVEARILEASKQLLDMQRAWFLPQGWEPNPKAVPPIDQVFDAMRSGGRAPAAAASG